VSDCTEIPGRADPSAMEPTEGAGRAARGGDPIRALLDRPIAPGDLDANTAAVAAPLAAAPLRSRSLVRFRLSGEPFAFDTRAAARVVPPRAVHRVPHRGDERFAGIANVGGELLLVARLDRVLGLAAPPAGGAGRRLVVFGGEGRRWAFEVDAVDGVERHDEAEFLAPPATVARAADTCTVALLPLADGTRLAVLDHERIARALERSVR